MSVEHDWAIFDREASGYDAWYETQAGTAIFTSEIDALRPLLVGLPRPWLEVGVGSGRFAVALGIEVGVDPALGALQLAARRGIRAVEACGETLPFRDGAFGAVLLAITLCFLADPLAALREARRVLSPGGGVLLGLVPAEGSWARHYRRLAARGHPYYRLAHFFTRGEIRSLLAASGLRQMHVRSALFGGPEAEVRAEPARQGDDRAAGFMALLTAPAAPVSPKLAEASPGYARASRSREAGTDVEGGAGPRPQCLTRPRCDVFYTEAS